MQIFGEKDFEPRLANGEQKPEVGRDLAIEISAGRQGNGLSLRDSEKESDTWVLSA